MKKERKILWSVDYNGIGFDSLGRRYFEDYQAAKEFASNTDYSDKPRKRTYTVERANEILEEQAAEDSYVEWKEENKYNFTSTIYFIKGRQNFDEEVDQQAYAWYMSDVKPPTKNEIIEDIANLIGKDDQMTKEEALKAIEEYDYANYGIYSIKEFAEAIYNATMKYYD